MPRPRFCRNPACEHSRRQPPGGWCSRAGFYDTIAHGRVQRYRCRRCGRLASDQTESMHYYAKRQLRLREIQSRLRGGSSMRDIGREMGCSRTAVANAAVRLGRQAMASHARLLCGHELSGSLCFDGLVSAVTSRDYPSQITTLGDSKLELVLAMTHCVTERGGTRTDSQRKRIERKRAVWKPAERALTSSITLLVNELTRFAGPSPLRIDVDEHPIYEQVIAADLALDWYRKAKLLSVERTSGEAPRTVSNPLFFVNYIDRMIRHRMKEHTRKSIALGRNSTMQMHRMWIFAWDHNTRQPARVRRVGDPSRAEQAGVSAAALRSVQHEFYTRRMSLRGIPFRESMRQVWLGQLDSPPVRWKKRQKSHGPRIPEYARLDLRFACSDG
jgi:transposase-like protein